MAEYIDRILLGDAVTSHGVVHYEDIMSMPTADVVEREHGKWIWQLADNGWADNICSVCGYTINDDIHVHVDYNFCPNCGADMRGGDDG